MDIGKFFKNYWTRRFGVHVFVMKKSCNFRTLFGQILSTSEIVWGVDDNQRKSCGRWTTFKGSRWGVHVFRWNRGENTFFIE